ncbi:hypothetical protein [Streptomyces spongiae]|uniref:Uncharacterized protein n=1 Tax=Streptomyces spongiae TaxID=565072 RepID=A0A5N8XL97_9ACTN|nr:hypothetical protein [Streptomyces spongiae]MPY60192.1 hypothetical protein [Streptomyces spongiae]
MDDERETLITGAVIGGGGTALLLVCGLIWGFPWHAMLLVVAFTVVLGFAIAAMSLADVRRDAERRARSLRGDLPAVVHRDGVEAGIVCSTDGDAEGEIRRLGLPQDVESVRGLLGRTTWRPVPFVVEQAFAEPTGIHAPRRGLRRGR